MGAQCSSAAHPTAGGRTTNCIVISQVPASAFEVVQMTSIYTAATLPQGAAPRITSFIASPTSISPGGQATLTWQASGAVYTIVSPQVGAVRGNSLIVTPGQTTTYTLHATDQAEGRLRR